jgi:hypothetical protein
LAFKKPTNSLYLFLRRKVFKRKNLYDINKPLSFEISSFCDEASQKRLHGLSFCQARARALALALARSREDTCQDGMAQDGQPGRCVWKELGMAKIWPEKHPSNHLVREWVIELLIEALQCSSKIELFLVSLKSDNKSIYNYTKKLHYLHIPYS